jgi:methyl coenzyme M reductase gamma subunit
MDRRVTVSVKQHREEWDEILSGIHDVVDAVAFQDGHIDYITFEFSHFMSPQSAYSQAGHLYNRYREYFNY